MTFEELVKAVELLAGDKASRVEVVFECHVQNVCYTCHRPQGDRESSFAYSIFVYPHHAEGLNAEFALGKLREAMQKQKELPAEKPTEI